MVTRVATGFQNQSSILQLQQTQSDLTTSAYQITSGYKSDRLLGYAKDANALLNLYDVQSNNQMYLDNITVAKNRLEASESALQGMQDLLTEAAKLWTIARNENSSSTRASLAPEAESLTNTFYDLLKTQFDDRYIFSGLNGGETPTNDTPTATAFPGSPVPTDYYIGDSSRASIISGSGLTSEYGVTGNEQALAELKAGFEALWYGLENNSEADIDNAITTLENASDNLSSLLGEVGGQLNNVNQLQTRHTDTKTFLQEQIDEIEKVDVTEAITKYSQQEVVLQASMSIITRLSQISLLNFM